MSTLNPNNPVEELPAVVVNIGSSFSTFFSSPWVVFILVPVLVTLGAIFLKAFARPKFSLNSVDKVVGFDLGITACVTLVISGFHLVNSQLADDTAAALNKQHYLIGLLIVLGLFILTLIYGAYVMSKNGWQDSGNNGYVTKSGWPISINIGGAILLVIAFVLTGGSFL